MFSVLVRTLDFVFDQKRSLNISIMRMSHKPKGIDVATSQQLTGSRNGSILGGQEILSPFP